MPRNASKTLLSLYFSMMLVGGLSLFGFKPAFGQTPTDTQWKFHLEEARIKDVHRAIKLGQISCQGVLQAYINRIRAYDGACVELANPNDGNDPKNFFPNVSQYTGTPLQPGTMRPTISDPSKLQMSGTISGERSVTCKAACDAHPSTGPLPSTCNQACDAFRAQPDALQRAMELDQKFGTNPDLAALPLYCTPFSVKDVFDAKDMRSTGGADVAYAMDAAPADSTIVAELRAKGAIILAKANLSEYNGASGDPGGEAKPESVVLGAGNSRSTWGGNPCNPYDTERAPAQAASSSGSGVSVAANLVLCSICEETGGSSVFPPPT